MLAPNPKADPNKKRSSCQHGQKQGGPSAVTNFGTKTMLNFVKGSTSAWIIYNKTHNFGS